VWGRWRDAALEVKAPTGRATGQQQRFLAMVEAHGGIAGIALSVGDVAPKIGGEW